MVSVKDGFLMILQSRKLFRLRIRKTVVDEIPCSTANVKKIFSRP